VSSLGCALLSSALGGDIVCREPEGHKRFISQGDSERLDVEQAAHHLARTAALGFLGAATKKPKGFGRAGSRSDLQTTLARSYALDLLSKVPSGEVVAFTDGASRGNPGPAGAGSTLYIKNGNSPPMDDFTPLGKSTNNLSELWAIGMAIDRLSRLPPEGRPYSLSVFTDSSYSIGCLSLGYVSKTNKDAVRALRHKIKISKTSLILDVITFLWVPGHAGLPGNELADHLANCGADASKGGTISINIPDSLLTTSFLYS
jgi:ribonuclease HI